MIIKIIILDCDQSKVGSEKVHIEKNDLLLVLFNIGGYSLLSSSLLFSYKNS